MVDVDLPGEGRVHHDTVVDRLGGGLQEVHVVHRVEAAAAGQEVEVRLHQLVAIDDGAGVDTGEGDVAAASFRLQNHHSRADAGDFHQAADDGRRGREEIELVLGDFDLAGEDDLIDAREGVVIEEVGLGFAVPLAAGCLKNLVGALVHVAVQLLGNLQGIAAHLGAAQNGQDIGSYLHRFFLMKGLQESAAYRKNSADLTPLILI